MCQQLDNVGGDLSAVIAICHHVFMQMHGKTFKLAHQERYVYRDIQKDVLRCCLLLIPIQLKQYLVSVVKLPASQITKDIPQ